MESIYACVPLDEVSTSMTINAPAAVLTCMYAAVGKKSGVPPARLKGTVQTDMLKEYIAQKEWAYPPEAHLRIVRDMMVYCTKHMPQWNYVSISGYHIREAGSSAVQELAFTLADGFSYVELGKEAGLNVDDFAPRLSFFFNSTMDFFEEIAKFRAARRIWATVMREKYGAKNPRSLLMRFHTQTSGASLTWQQPLNNIVRTTIEALAGVLGGTQSLHTNSYDEAYQVPHEDAARIALRTQQILAHESGVANTIDPLGGSYFVEWLTDYMEDEAYKYFARIDALGGVIPAIRKGFFQQEIANSAYRYQKEVEDKERTIVGVNEYVEPEEEEKVAPLRVTKESFRRQLARLAAIRKDRDAKKWERAVAALRKAAEGDGNLMPCLVDAVRAEATLGEICNTLRDVFGTW